MTEKTTSIDDLKRRAKQLDAAGEAAFNVYEKLLAWRMLVYEVIEIMEKTAAGGEANRGLHGRIMEGPLDCEAVETGGRGKADIRQWFVRKP